MLPVTRTTPGLTVTPSNSHRFERFGLAALGFGATARGCKGLWEDFSTWRNPPSKFHQETLSSPHQLVPLTNTKPSTTSSTTSVAPSVVYDVPNSIGSGTTSYTPIDDLSQHRHLPKGSMIGTQLPPTPNGRRQLFSTTCHVVEVVLGCIALRASYKTPTTMSCK